MMPNIAICVSGRGSNMLAIIEACVTKKLDAKVVLVVSDKQSTVALSKAQSLNICICVCRDEREMLVRMKEYSVDLICLAGYMKILSVSFLKHFSHRILNIHPSLLPKYKGLHTHKRVLKAGESESGCTVHYVDTGIDTGTILLQAVVRVLKDDTEESLAERILKEEHRLYPQAIKKHLQWYYQ